MVHVPLSKSQRDQMRTARRMAQKRRLAQQPQPPKEPPLPGLDPSNVSAEYLTKLRVTALRIAHECNPGASPFEVINTARDYYRVYLRFLTREVRHG
jgi:hypothetical protein